MLCYLVRANRLATAPFYVHYTDSPWFCQCQNQGVFGTKPTVRNARAIMVLEQGEIIERGDHDDLISQGGKYYQLYTGQAELS